MWDEEDCPLSSAFVDDLTRLNTLLPLGAQIDIPWLLVHGDKDDVVPIQESREIFNSTACKQELIELSDSNHVFADDALPEMIQAVTQWMQRLTDIKG